MTGESGADSAALRWAGLLSGWGLPQAIIERAPESPWGHEPRRFAVDETLDRDTMSARWAREVLPPVGGTVLDVGCGGGRSSLTLVPPASELIGVDRSGAMLDEFVAAASAIGVARRTVHGAWPDVADQTPVADVVVCHHVLYDVPDVVPFASAMLPPVDPFSRRPGRDRHRKELGPVISRRVAMDQRVGQEPAVVAPGEVEALVRPPRLLTLQRAGDDGLREVEQVVQLERGDELGVEGVAPVVEGQLGPLFVQLT